MVSVDDDAASGQSELDLSWNQWFQVGCSGILTDGKNHDDQVRQHVGDDHGLKNGNLVAASSLAAHDELNLPLRLDGRANEDIGEEVSDKPEHAEAHGDENVDAQALLLKDTQVES
jgi:hypothetical protein